MARDPRCRWLIRRGLVRALPLANERTKVSRLVPDPLFVRSHRAETRRRPRLTTRTARCQRRQGEATANGGLASGDFHTKGGVASAGGGGKIEGSVGVVARRRSERLRDFLLLQAPCQPRPTLSFEGLPQERTPLLACQHGHQGLATRLPVMLRASEHPNGSPRLRTRQWPAVVLAPTE